MLVSLARMATVSAYSLGVWVLGGHAQSCVAALWSQTVQSSLARDKKDSETAHVKAFVPGPAGVKVQSIGSLLVTTLFT